MKLLRVGIVGCGKIADGHAEVLKFLEGAHLVAVCDREPLLAEQLAVRFGIPHWYCSLDEMLGAEQLDVVHITTPPGVHLDLTRQCVQAGAHVFLEKPLALRTDDCRQLIDSVTSAGLQMSINYWPNFDPPAMKLKQMLASGLIGDPVHIEAFIGYDLAGTYGQALMSDPAHWVHRLPGKLFHNMMDHIFNRIVPFFPDVRPDVHAFAFKRRKAIRGDATDAMLDELRVVLQADGVSAFGSLCSHARPVANQLRIFGTKNTAVLDFANRTVVLEATPRYPSALGRLMPAIQMSSRYLAQGWSNIKAFKRHEFQYFAGMSNLLELFYTCIRSGGEPPIPYAEMLRVAEVMDQVIDQVYPAAGETQ